MSATLTEFFEAVVKAADEWLLKLGIDVSGIREENGVSSGAASPPPAVPHAPAPEPPVAIAPEPPKREPSPGEAAYDAAVKELRETEGEFASARPGSEMLNVKLAYEAMPGPPADRAGITDYEQALETLRPRLELMRNIDFLKLARFDALTIETKLIAQKCAGLKARAGGMPGVQKFEAESQAKIEAAKQNVDVALKERNYQAAVAAAIQIKNATLEIMKPYDLAFEGDRNGPLFGRAAKILSAGELSPELQKLQSEYAAAVGNLEEKKTLAIWERSLTTRIAKARQVVKADQKGEVAAWFDGFMAKPADATGDSGLASGLTTMAEFATMDEATKLNAAMATELGGNVKKATQIAIDKYAGALANGVKLDLSPSQIIAIHAYSKGDYDRINGLLRGSLDLTKTTPAQIDRAKVQAELVLQAMAKLPKYDPGAFPLFRFETPYGDYLKTRYQEDSPVFEIKEFWSTGGGGGAVITTVSVEILIWGKRDSQAKDVTMLTNAGKGEGSRTDGAALKGQAAGEVLFPPGTRFKTRKRHDVGRVGKEALQRLNSQGVPIVAPFGIRVEITEE